MTDIEKIVFKAVSLDCFRELHEICALSLKNTTVNYDDFINVFYRLVDRDLFHKINEYGVNKYKRKTNAEIIETVK